MFVHHVCALKHASVNGTRTASFLSAISPGPGMVIGEARYRYWQAITTNTAYLVDSTIDNEMD